MVFPDVTPFKNINSYIDIISQRAVFVNLFDKIVAELLQNDYKKLVKTEKCKVYLTKQRVCGMLTVIE